MGERPSLTTARLLLRPFSLSDAPALQRLAGVREVSDNTLTIPHPYTLEDAIAWIATHQATFDSGAGLAFAITRKEALCGAIGLRIAPEHERAELGYWIGVPYWGQGFCTEAAEAVVEYGFTVLNLHRIHAGHFPRNPASGRVMRKIGMRHEGSLRQHVRKWDCFEDLEVYGLLSEEWRARTPPT
jgi:Acetyltransferases, including N-acetylases of ribosomal proteins